MALGGTADDCTDPGDTCRRVVCKWQVGLLFRARALLLSCMLVRLHICMSSRLPRGLRGRYIADWLRMIEVSVERTPAGYGNEYGLAMLGRRWTALRIMGEGEGERPPDRCH
jgi:hypothetical protein